MPICFRELDHIRTTALTGHVKPITISLHKPLLEDISNLLGSSNRHSAQTTGCHSNPNFPWCPSRDVGKMLESLDQTVDSNLVLLSLKVKFLIQGIFREIDTSKATEAGKSTLVAGLLERFLELLLRLLFRPPDDWDDGCDDFDGAGITTCRVTC
jgi:hypothetical protein